MNEFKYNMAPSIERVKKEAEKSIDDHISKVGRQVVYDLLRSGQNGGVEGLAHEIIRKRIEDYILSDKFTDKIDQAIESLSDSEINNAIKILLGSKSRKHLFQSTSQVDS